MIQAVVIFVSLLLLFTVSAYISPCAIPVFYPLGSYFIFLTSLMVAGLFILGAVLHLLVPPKEKNIKKRGKEKEIFSSTSSYRLVESSV
ncbi:hypothetical protein EE612_043354 [Oryza sativa]|nr:hypothetical protein EE612_043354 [Oryza sativa]